MISLPGELSIKTVHGRNGPFNIGRLVVSLGKFTVKDPELDQFKEGRYEGDFIIREIRQHQVPTDAGVFTQMRAHLAGMTLSGIDALNKVEASTMGTQEPDPVDEEVSVTVPASTTQTPATEESKKAARAPRRPAPVDSPLAIQPPAHIHATSSGSQGATAPADTASDLPDDAQLFGHLWPLPDSFKLDSTVGRRKLRMQIQRLASLGYEFHELAQAWQLASVTA